LLAYFCAKIAFKMLRRRPTAITLTTEDVAIYEDARAREAQLRDQSVMQAEQQKTPNGKVQNTHPNGSLKNPGFGAPQIKTREERLGLGGGSSRG